MKAVTRTTAATLKTILDVPPFFSVGSFELTCLSNRFGMLCILFITFDLTFQAIESSQGGTSTRNQSRNLSCVLLCRNSGCMNYYIDKDRIVFVWSHQVVPKSIQCTQISGEGVNFSAQSGNHPFHQEESNLLEQDEYQQCQPKAESVNGSKIDRHEAEKLRSNLSKHDFKPIHVYLLLFDNDDDDDNVADLFRQLKVFIVRLVRAG